MDELIYNLSTLSVNNLPHINNLIEKINQSTDYHNKSIIEDAYKYIHQAQLFINEYTSNKNIDMYISKYCNNFIFVMKSKMKNYFVLIEKLKNKKQLYNLKNILVTIITFDVINNELFLLQLIIKFYDLYFTNEILSY